MKSNIYMNMYSKFEYLIGSIVRNLFLSQDF